MLSCNITPTSISLATFATNFLRKTLFLVIAEKPLDLPFPPKHINSLHLNLSAAFFASANTCVAGNRSKPAISPVGLGSKEKKMRSWT